MWFEGELGIVIGKRCREITPEQAPDCIFGYTCVNDVTARDLLKQDPAFVHWTRAESFDGFGPFGPCIATAPDPAEMRVQVVLAGQERQDYPVSDIIFSPHEIVSRISGDMTLEPGDLSACGTSVGASAMQDGEPVEVRIPGVGVLANRFGQARPVSSAVPQLLTTKNSCTMFLCIVARVGGNHSERKTKKTKTARIIGASARTGAVSWRDEIH